MGAFFQVGSRENDSRKNHIIIKKGGRNAHEKSFCKGAVNRQMRAECSPRVRPYAEFIGGLEVRMKRDEELWLWL